MLKLLVLSLLLIFLICWGSGRLATSQERGTVRIGFERVGGIAGISVIKTVDDATLSVKEASQLKRLIDSSDFFHLPSNLSSRPPYPDRYQYKITVEKDGQSHTVVVNEGAIPERLQPLLEWLR